MTAAIARLKRMSGPATAYAAPTRRKIAAPTIAPSAAIVMSNRPRSRVTRTRTEADAGPAPDTERSEEHTSELQSQSNLVCRLLLEKKKRISADGVTKLSIRAILKVMIQTSTMLVAQFAALI